MADEKLAPKTVTETLVGALEQADRFTKVIVVGETKEGDKLSHVLLLSGDCSLADANYLMDLVKHYTVVVPGRSCSMSDPDDDPDDDPEHPET